MLVALIPVKEFDQAKTRLAPVLDAVARRELAVAMFRDVLAATMACDEIDGVAVVSRDPEALTIARIAGADGLDEPGDLNEALTSASRWAAERGAKRIMVLASDLPFAHSELLSLRIHESPLDEVWVAVPEDRGTNAILMPTGAIAFRFGPQSGEQHIEAARLADLPFAWDVSSDLHLDIDTPADLERLREQIDGVGAHTRAALERIGLMRAR